ncbi:MAG: rRNA maturation RNase YbeY [Firmicutes bacterium]|nr:rRNA maturation RNase YbeY [Bacillota bacterium]
MKLLINDRSVIEPALLDTMRQAAECCLEGEGLDPDGIEISLSFVSEEEIHQLNRDYRGVDRVTDVLSFPLIEDLNELAAAEEDEEDMEPVALGDVVICLPRAEEQAREYGHSREREIVYLYVHSVLHLLGYDHMEERDKQEMRAREEEVMQAVDLQREASPLELYKIAEKARENAYAPFSGFRVGAALLTEEGRVYTGVNVENSSYGATICAERTAFVKAISEGERKFTAIAISAGEVPSLPCGICRQFMFEFAPKIRIITGPIREGEPKGGLKVQSLEQLLPEGFRLEGETK